MSGELTSDAFRAILSNIPDYLWLDAEASFDMVKLLVSRQNLALLTMAMWDGDVTQQEDSLKVLISSIGANRLNNIF